LGAADGYDAVSQWRWERMSMGGTCFLDTTAFWGNGMPQGRAPGWLDYYTGWIGAVLDGGTVHPGTCCSASDAPVLAEGLLAAYGERRRTPKRMPFWSISPRPMAIAADGAPLTAPLGDDAARWRVEIWQSESGVTRQSFGETPLVVSPCWATTPDPSFDPSLIDAVIDPASLTAVLRPGAAPSVTTAFPSPVMADARALMDACLEALARARLGGTSPFPYGIGDVEIHLTERDGAAYARIRVSATNRSGQESD
jgi:hypothetical protein